LAIDRAPFVGKERCSKGDLDYSEDLFGGQTRAFTRESLGFGVLLQCKPRLLLTENCQQFSAAA
jgi:hypothetical protein